MVLGSLTCLVEEWPDYIPGAVSDKQRRVGDYFLGVARSIGCYQRQDQNGSTQIGSSQQIADVSGRLVTSWSVSESKCAGDVGTEKQERYETAFVVETVVDEGGCCD